MIKQKYKCIKQMDETDCGAASLATVCLYYGKNVEIANVRTFAHVDRYGSNMLGLCDAAQKLGFDAEGLSGDFENFLSADFTLPCVAHVIMDGALEHFIVVFEINRKTIIVGDPAKGIIQYTAEGFKEIWTGHILTMKPNQNFKKERRKANSLLPFFKIVFEHKKKFAAIVLLSLIATFLNVAASFFVYYLVDVVIPYVWMERLIRAAVSIILIYFVALMVNTVRTRLVAELSKVLNHDLMCRYIHQLLYIDYEFYECHTTGDLVSRMQDTDIVRDAVSKVTITALLDVFMMSVSIAVLAYLNFSLFAISLGIVSVYALAVAKFNKPIHTVSSELREKDANATTTFLETINGVETVRVYQSEAKLFSKNETNISELMERFRKATFLFSEQSILADSIMSIGEVLILAVGGISVIHGTISLGILFMFYTLFAMCLTPVKNMVDLLPVIHKAEVSARRLQDVFSAITNIGNCLAIGKDISLDKDISIKNLSFRYGNRDLVLDQFSLDINRGERIALIGNSGSGKSTLAKLLLCLYKAEDGKILFGEKNINEIPISVIRKKIAYVSQNTFLFRGSILDNIRIGNPDMTHEEIVDFLEETSFKKFIAQLPMGYQTVLNENGNNLSGGQRQMVALARALIKQADILILDEATSAIDVQTEKIVEEAIQAVYSDTTTIIIAHHYRGVQYCDRVAVIAHGGVEAIGTPEAMIKTNCTYQEYCGL